MCVYVVYMYTIVWCERVYIVCACVCVCGCVVCVCVHMCTLHLLSIDMRYKWNFRCPPPQLEEHSHEYLRTLSGTGLEFSK